jgi:hypothetical protein
VGERIGRCLSRDIRITSTIVSMTRTRSLIPWRDGIVVEDDEPRACPTRGAVCDHLNGAARDAGNARVFVEGEYTRLDSNQ